MKVTPVSVTMPINPDIPCKTPEDLIVYEARVSNPKNQANFATGPKLLAHCMEEGHWSVFTMVDWTVEIVTSRAISAQALRHSSFSPQEFSQRYAEVPSIEVYDARRQDTKNRQNSIDDLPEETKEWFREAQETVANLTTALYQDSLARGIAKESARFLLPMASTSVFYFKGSVRSWIHYFQVRAWGKGVQEEHREIALAAYELFRKQFPIVAEAVELYLKNR